MAGQIRYSARKHRRAAQWKAERTYDGVVEVEEARRNLAESKHQARTMINCAENRAADLIKNARQNAREIMKEAKLKLAEKKRKADFGGRPVEEGRLYLERLFSPVNYSGPGGCIICVPCGRELSIDEFCNCTQEDGQDNNGVVKSSRCPNERSGGTRMQCWFDRRSETMDLQPCWGCRPHLDHIAELWNNISV